jgi:hypothetical protein
MRCKTEPGDSVSIVRNYLAKGWIVECVDDTQSGWLTFRRLDGTYDTNPCLKKRKFYRVQDTDGEGYFVTLEGVPGRWRTGRFKVFTSKLEELKYDVPVKIKLPIASRLLGEDLNVVMTKRGGGNER